MKNKNTIMGPSPMGLSPMGLSPMGLSPMGLSPLEQIDNIWVVHYNGKTFKSFTSEAGARAYLEILQTPIVGDGD